MSTQQKNEHGILKILDHPNIIKLLDYYEDDEIILIIEELCDSNLLMVL
jgi:serine/threonine protein kinase